MSNQKEQAINVNLNAVELLAPVVAAQMVNALYSALLLKKFSGVEITADVEQETWTEVFRRWSTVMPTLAKSAREIASQQASDSQS